MAFSFGTQGGAAAGGGGKVTTGPEFQEVETQHIGFLSIGGNAKVRLLPNPWPEDSLPATTSSLLSVTSVKGLLAAAGPDGVVVARTDSVRKAYRGDPRGDSDVRPFQPELLIPLPAKVSHLAFSTDGSVLAVAVESGDGLALFDVSSLLQGNTQPTSTLNLNGATLRALAQNPNPDTAELFAIVTSKGELLVANLKSNQLSSGPAGPVLKTGVSSVSWSNKGTQLVAGLGNGTISQLKPGGEVQAEIPRAPEIGDDHHVSSLQWLANNLFFIVYTPTNSPDGNSPPSTYYIAQRKPPDQYEFRKLPEVSAPFGLPRNPAYQFTARMRDFEPDLKEILIVASTASTDIGLITQSATPDTLAFATMMMADDSKRAVLPMTEDMNDTSPIGMCLDLSSTDNVPTPIPGDDEIKDSSSPLPALMVLTNDGMLSSWWFVHSESIKQQKPYSGLVAVKSSGQQGHQQITPAPATMPMSTTPAKSPFGSATFGQTGFGQSSTPAFGATSAIGMQSKPGLGSFGLTTTPQKSGGTPFGSPAFGQTASLGAGRPQFGQPSMTGTTPTASPGFTSFGATGGFGSFASSNGGFAGAAQTAASGTSPFAKLPSTDNPFGKAAPSDNPFGKPTAQESPFAKPAPSDNPFGKAGQPLFGSTTTPSTASSIFGQSEKPMINFGVGGSGFTLGSSMKPATPSAMDEDKPEPSSGALSMGSAFSNMLGSIKTETPKQTQPIVSSTPASAPPTSIFSTGKQAVPQEQKPPSFSTPFSAQPQQKTEPETSPQTTTPTTSFAIPSLLKKTPATPPPGDSVRSPSTVVAETPKEAPPTPLAKVVEPPLPPESTSKLSYAPGDTSASSSGGVSSGVSIEEAPLPPDFVKPKKQAEVQKEAAVISLPEESEEGDADFEDSGEEVGHDLSPAEDVPEQRVQSLKTSPESSFGGNADKSPMSDLFTKGSTPASKSGRRDVLFGEIEKPIFPPPKLPEPRHRLSPRSPSPVRRRSGQILSRPDGFRSTSAPSAPDRAISRRKATLEGSMLARQVSSSRDEVGDQAKAQREAEKLAAETQPLSEDDEDEQLRADLARPISPSPTLDPFLPHQGYTGETMKPGIPGQIELLFRDINTMIDTLGINSRSLSSYLLYEQTTKEDDYGRWLRLLRSDSCSGVLNERHLLSEVEKLQLGVEALDAALQKGRIEGVQEMFDRCQQLISKDLVKLRGQFASLQRTLDAHTDSIAIASAPLSSDQVSLQQELRKAATETRSKVADLERDISVFRAKIADCSKATGSDGDRNLVRPTVEAVTSTISTMTSMAERKSGDVDVIEAQLRRMGIDVSGSPLPGRSREASPFATPLHKRLSPGRLPVTPGSQTSQDGHIRSVYQTPDSGTVGSRRFRSSLLGRSAQGAVGDLITPDDLQSGRAKAARRKEAVGHLRSALGNRSVKVRPLEG